MRVQVQWGQSFILQEKKKTLGGECSDGFATMGEELMPLSCTLKTVKVEKCILCLFYHTQKRKYDLFL